MRNPSAPTNSNSTKNVRTPCCTKVGLKRGPWTPEEDELLASYITKEGEGRWRTLPKRAGLLRCGKSCRLRWMNYLRPCVKRGHIAADEEDLILRLHRLLGNRWSLIAGRIPGRTDNEIKNYWNTHLSKKLISQGIDPRTHKPLNQTDHHHHHHHQSSPAANPNPNPSDLGLEGEGGHGHVQGDCTQEGLHSKVESDDLQNGDGAGTRMVIGLKGGSSHGNSEQEDDIDYCSDDIFSSFLNSLINDDMFVQQQQQQQQQQGSVEPVTPGFGYGTFWEPLISTAPGVNGDEHGRESKR